MNDMEKVLFDLFGELRDELSEEYGFGMSLKAAGPTFSLRVRRQKNLGDEKQPYFALVLERQQTNFRISYHPNGVPPVESEVIIVECGSASRLHSLVRGYVDKERKRLIEYRERQ
jgi:hypothetical protein